jgi:hypothetical protein
LILCHYDASRVACIESFFAPCVIAGRAFERAGHGGVQITANWLSNTSIFYVPMLKDKILGVCKKDERNSEIEGTMSGVTWTTLSTLICRGYRECRRLQISMPTRETPQRFRISIRDHGPQRHVAGRLAEFEFWKPFKPFRHVMLYKILSRQLYPKLLMCISRRKRQLSCT